MPQFGVSEPERVSSVQQSNSLSSQFVIVSTTVGEVRRCGLGRN